MFDHGSIGRWNHTDRVESKGGSREWQLNGEPKGRARQPMTLSVVNLLLGAGAAPAAELDLHNHDGHAIGIEREEIDLVVAEPDIACEYCVAESFEVCGGGILAELGAVAPIRRALPLDRVRNVRGASVAAGLQWAGGGRCGSIRSD